MSEKDIRPQGTGPARQAFWRVLDAASVAVLATDDAGKFIYENQTAVALLGYAPADLGQLHVSDLEAMDPGSLHAQLERLKLRRVWSGLVLLRRKQGDMISTAVNAFSAKPPEGQDTFVEMIHPAGDDRLPANLRSPGPGLTEMEERELQTLMLCSEGFAEEEIGVLLGLRNEEVQEHIHAARRQLNTSSTTEACIRALKAGLIV